MNLIEFFNPSLAFFPLILLTKKKKKEEKELVRQERENF